MRTIVPYLLILCLACMGAAAVLLDVHAEQLHRKRLKLLEQQQALLEQQLDRVSPSQRTGTRGLNLTGRTQAGECVAVESGTPDSNEE